MSFNTRIPITDGWSYKIKVNDLKDPVFQFYYRSRPITHDTLVDKLAEQLAGYCLMERDLNHIEVWAKANRRLWIEKSGSDIKPEPYNMQKSNDTDGDIYIRALMVAIVTTYGKLFSAADGRKVKLDKSQLPEECELAHNFLINMRNKFTAHAGGLHENCQIAFMYKLKKKTGEYNSCLFPMLFQSSLIHLDEDDDHLFREIRNIIDTKKNQLCEKIYKRESEILSNSLSKP